MTSQRIRRYGYANNGSRSMPRRVCGRSEILEPRQLLASDLVINEFMARNETTLLDSFGQASDWIEVHNLTDSDVDLNGWSLTDRADNLDKWSFPPRTIEAGEYIVVFASGRDLKAGELHTNFRLSGNGEYLALVEPDEATIATEFNEFPPQVTDVAFGLGASAQPTTLAYADGTVRAFVPDDDSIEGQWQQRAFDDNQWLDGTGGVGFGADFTDLIGVDLMEEMADRSSAYTRQRFQVNDASTIDNLELNIQYNDGFVAYLNGQEIAQRNASPPADSPASGLVSFWDFEDRLVDSASDYPANSGVSQDDLTARGGDARFADGLRGRALAIGIQNGDTTDLSGALTNDVKLPATYTIEAWIKPTELSDSWQRLVLNWGAEQSYHFAIRNNNGFNNGVSLFHAQSNGQQPNANGGTVRLDEWQHIAGVADGDMLRVYLNGEQVDAVPYDGTIHEANAEGLGIADSFASLSDIKYNGLLDELAIWDVPLTAEQLRSHYEAGSAGYGLMASNNGFQWDSTAFASRPTELSTQIETIDLENFIEFVEPGENVLAVRGLNVAAHSPNFLIRSELQASQTSVDPTNQRYYPRATPGSANASGVIDLGPIVDNVAHEVTEPAGITTTVLVGDTSEFSAFVPSNGLVDSVWTDVDYVTGILGESWTEPEAGGIGFDVDATYDNLIGTDLEAQMLGNNATAYIRSEFGVADTSVVDRLSLNVKYDDGFIAYLNGVEVARRNAPQTAATEGLATYYSFNGDIEDHASDYENSVSATEDDFLALAASGAINVSYADGIHGQAVRISRTPGEAAMLTAADSDDLDLADNWTVEAFVKPDVANTGEWDRFATKWHPGGNSWHWAFRGGNNGIDLFLNGAQQINNVDTASVPLNEWSHVAITGDAADGTIKAWLNGVEVGSAPYVAVQPSASPLTLGNFVLADSGLQFSGLVDEFAIWNVALSQEQLFDHFNDGNYALVPKNLGPPPDLWQASATMQRPDAAAVEAEFIDISQHANLITTGKNVLAIHGLNSTASDNDFLIVPELVAGNRFQCRWPLANYCRSSPHVSINRQRCTDLSRYVRCRTASSHG